VESFRLANEILVANDDVDVQEGYSRRNHLPATNDARQGKRCWIMAGFYVKNEIKPTELCTEAKVLLSLIEEVRSTKAIDLDPSPSLDRKVPAIYPNMANKDKLYLAVGGPKL
jgi:hypothetical protein